MKNVFLVGVLVGATGASVIMQKSKCKAILDKITKK